MTNTLLKLHHFRHLLQADKYPKLLLAILGEDNGNSYRKLSYRILLTMAIKTAYAEITTPSEEDEETPEQDTIRDILYKDSCFDCFPPTNPSLSIKNKEDQALEKKKKQNTKEQLFFNQWRGSDSSAIQSAWEHPPATATE